MEAALITIYPVTVRSCGCARTYCVFVIAEDEALIRLDLKEMLEEEGYSVVAGEAGDGESAVELADQACAPIWSSWT